MPVTLNIIESVTELGQEVVEVVLASASTPGPAGPGVPTGGTDGQVLTKASATDYDTAWEDPTGGAGGAPTDATYLVTAAHGDLSAEVVVGATPGGELGGTWASPTVDATHSGSSHAGVQAAAEATAAAALSAHSTDTTSVHGIADTSALALTANHPTNATFNDHSARHENGGADEISIAGLDGIPAELQTHLDDTTDAHDASAVSVDSTNLSGTAIHVQGSLEELDNLLDDHSARHEDGGADEISIQGLAGTPTELTNHLNDTSDAHDASAISLADAGGNTTETDVEGAIAELYGLVGGGSGPVELEYAQFTSNVTITATVEDSADTVVSAGSVAFDGATIVLIEFFCQRVDMSATGGGLQAVFNLFDGSSDIGRVAQAGSGIPGWAIYGVRRLTPTNGSHTYSIRAWLTSSGTVVAQAGAGGDSTSIPGFIRITTVAT